MLKRLQEHGQTAKEQSSNTDLSEPSALNWNALGIEYCHGVAPTPPRAETGDFAIARKSDIVQPLEVQQDALAPDTGPTRVRGVAAASDGVFYTEKFYDFDRFGHISRMSGLDDARRVGVACFRPNNFRNFLK